MLTSPTNDINSAKALEAMIDNYRGQIGLQEETIRQNKRILDSQEYTIGQNTLKLKEQDEFIINRTERQTILTKDIEVLEQEKADLMTENEKAKTAQARIEAELVGRLNEQSAKENALQEKSDNLDSRGNAVTMRELAVDEKEKELGAKHEAIKNLASKL